MTNNTADNQVLTQQNILDNLNQGFGFENISTKIWDMYLATIDSEYAKEWTDRERQINMHSIEGFTNEGGKDE